MYDIRSHTTIYSDPYESDTDGDGISDGVEMGAQYSDSNGNPFYSVNSYPDNPDSDEDGLSDYEESRSHTIYVADTHDSAIEFLNAIIAGEDSTQYLHQVTVDPTDPMDPYSDGDTLNDGDELSLGTNPHNADTDNDHIMDGAEEGYGEDPTIYDITPPQITVTSIYTSIHPLDPVNTYEYNIGYYAFDAGGLVSATVSKNGGAGDTFPFSQGAILQSANGHIYTNVLQTILDELGVVNVDITSSDRNTNSNTITAYHRPSMFSQWGAWLSSHVPNGETIAGCTGIVAGSADSVEEAVGVPVEIASDPVKYFSGLYSLAESLKQDPTLLGQIIASLPQSIKDRQEQQNPYPSGTIDHTAFEAGYYEGYVGTQILSMFAGGAAIKTVATSEDFVRLVGPVLQKINDIKLLLKSPFKLGVAKRVGILLTEDAGPLGPQYVAKVFTNLKTAVQEVKVLKYYNDLGSAKRTALQGYESDLGRYLFSSKDDGVNLLKALDDTTTQKMFTISCNEITSQQIVLLRNNLARLSNSGASTGDIGRFINNIDQLKNVDGISNIVERVVKGDYSNFKGAWFEADFATSRNVNSIIKLGEDFGISQPGDIDAIIMEGSQKVGYECKNINFASWGLKEQSYFGNANAGFKTLVQNHLIDDYKFVFKGCPPDEIIYWLNTHDIPWFYMP